MRQFFRYAIAGGIATLVHILIFHLLAWKVFSALQQDDLFVVVFGLDVSAIDVATRSMHSMLSNVVAFLCSNLTAYVINIRWVFTSGRHNRVVEIGLFYAVSGFSVLAGTSVMGLLIRYYAVQTTYAFTVNIIAAVMINYLARKYIIFKG
jgi:putative flippase GtrA